MTILEGLALRVKRHRDPTNEQRYHGTEPLTVSSDGESPNYSLIPVTVCETARSLSAAETSVNWLRQRIT